MRATVFTVLAVGIVCLVLVQQVVRAQTGPLPLVSVFELHLLLGAGVLAVVALVNSLGSGQAGAWNRLIGVAVVVLVVVRAGGELWSSPEPAAGAVLTVLSWNLEMDSKTGDEAADGIAGIDADVVALQELTPLYADAIEADDGLTSRYPYRILDPHEGPTGLGLLSKLPLVTRPQGAFRVLHAGLLLRDGRTVDLLDVHPTRPLYRAVGPIPLTLDTRDRDDDIERIGLEIDRLDTPDAALVVGDLNGTWFEPGLEPLRQRLDDAHGTAGTGPGFTWRPDQLEPLGFGVLRIDHVLTGSWLRPVSTSIDCGAVGDHCRLLVTLAVEPAAAP